MGLSVLRWSWIETTDPACTASDDIYADGGLKINGT
jgi:hypothetical protein